MNINYAQKDKNWGIVDQSFSSLNSFFSFHYRNIFINNFFRHTLEKEVWLSFTF